MFLAVEHTMRSALLAFGALVVITTTAPATAAPKITLYIGAHPLADDVFCVIEAPHQHVVAPVNRALFRVHDGHHHFVGDPVAHGWSGPKHAYVGHHPIDVHARLGVWVRDPNHAQVHCYIEGPHFHAHAPGPALKFKIKGDAYWYVGTFSPRYKRNKVRYARPVAAVYADIEYPRPVIEVTPPVGFVGIVAGPDGAHVTGGIAAGVEVVVPRPVLEVELGVGVGVGHHHGHYKKPKKRRKYRKRRGSKHWGYVRGGKSKKKKRKRRRRW